MGQQDRSCITIWEKMGEDMGRAFAAGVERVPSVRDAIRAHYAAKYGVCIDCREPLGGPSPSSICADCHAARVLAESLGGGGEGEA